MTSKIRTALIAAAALAAPMTLAGQAHAQARSVAVADQERAIAESNAFKTAMTQMQTTYKTQIDQLTARRTALQAEIQPLVTAYENAAKAPNATEASVRPSATALQTKNNAANQELQRIGAPVELARAYVIEQIALKMNDALKATMTARNVDLLLVPNATVSYQPAADITTALTGEINRLVPSVQIVPPAGWRPGQAQQPAAGAPAAAPQQPQPQGR